MSRRLAFDFEQISSESESSLSASPCDKKFPPEANSMFTKDDEEEEEEEDVDDDDDVVRNQSKQRETTARKNLRFDQQSPFVNTNNHHHDHHENSNKKKNLLSKLEEHVVNVNKMNAELRTDVNDFVAEDDVRMFFVNNNNNNSKMMKENDHDNDDGDYTMVVDDCDIEGEEFVTAVVIDDDDDLAVARAPERKYAAAFDVMRKALSSSSSSSKHNQHSQHNQQQQEKISLLVDAHGFSGKMFRGSWAGTTGMFAFANGSKIMTKNILPIEYFVSHADVLYQKRSLINGLKCFESFTKFYIKEKCRLQVQADKVKEFARMNCKALATALLDNNIDSNNDNNVSSPPSEGMTSKTKRAVELWDLLELLYKQDELGAQRGSAADTFRRKRSLSKWLKRSLRRTEKEKLTRMDSQPMDFDDDDDHFDSIQKNADDPISIALSKNDIVTATQLALNNGDIRMATIIAQTGVSDNIKNLANAQLNTWDRTFGNSMNKFIPQATRSVFELLAGRVETNSNQDGSSRNSTPKTRDWIENLARRVWFKHGITESTEAILASYERDGCGNETALFPHPLGVSVDVLEERKCEGIVKDARYDALLVGNSAHPFHQLSFGEDFLEYSSSWMATQFLLSQKLDDDDEELKQRGDEYTENLIAQISQLNSYFKNSTLAAAEKESIECEWKLFVALFVQNGSKRESLCKLILTETVDEWRKSAIKLDLLTRKLRIPKEWLDEAKEARANNEKPVLTNSLYR